MKNRIERRYGYHHSHILTCRFWRRNSHPMCLRHDAPDEASRSLRQRRFHDFSVRSENKKGREVALPARESREANAGPGPQGVGVEQVSLLSVGRAEWMRTRSGAPVTEPIDRSIGAPQERTLCPRLPTAQRVRHPKDQRPRLSHSPTVVELPVSSPITMRSPRECKPRITSQPARPTARIVETRTVSFWNTPGYSRSRGVNLSPELDVFLPVLFRHPGSILLQRDALVLMHQRAPDRRT